jgi:branched-chain amino acid transport system permease protein
VLAFFAVSFFMGDSATATVIEPDRGTTPTSVLLVQNMINGLVFGILLALASVGLSLIYGTTGLSNFAHGEQVTLGAVLCYFFATNQPVTFPLIPVEFSFGFPLWLAALLAIVIAGGTGWLQDRFMWNPIRKRGVPSLQQMIVSIGLSLALLNFIQWWIGGDRYRITTDIGTRFTFGDYYLGRQTALSLVIAVIVLVSVSLFLLRTRLGRATRAISDNPALAAASGIRVEGIIRLVWILATALAALGGILLALYEQGFGYDSGGRLLLLMFAAVTLGGLGQAFGALVGSLIIGMVTEVSTVFLTPDMKYAAALVILILILLVRPQGILGRAERVG